MAVVAAMAVVAPPSADAATTRPTFLRADHQQLGNNHVVADFNNDSLPDIAGQGAQSAAVLINRGDGTFGARAEYPVADWNQDLAAGDFNTDGKLDLAVTINNPQTSVSLLRGNGNGTFQAMVNLPNTSGFDSPSVVAPDLNNDGKTDLVLGHDAACFVAPCVIAKSITVLLGNGDGTFQPAREIDVGSPTARIAVGDFNRDGVRDLAIVTSRARLLILRGLGDGTFQQQPAIQLTDPNLFMEATDVDVADLNRDSISDLVVAVSLNGSKTAILIGVGDGTFRPPTLITEPNINIPHYQAIADYNLDGFQDLAISLGNGNNGLMEILNGNGDGSFQPAVMYLVPPPKSSISGFAVVAADLNSDTKADLTLGVVGASPSFAVLLNSTGSAPPATPAAPVLLKPAQDATAAQPVAFDWSDTAGATSYRIQVEDSSTFSSPFVVNSTVTPSQFTAPTLAARQHWWRVQGINSAGTAGAWSSVRRFTPQAAPTTVALSSVTLSPTSVVGGNSSTGTATLTAAAPTGGAVITLSSSNTGAATVPTSITVPAGATSRTFPIATSSVTAPVAVSISGHNGVTRTATLTVTPPGTQATVTLTATGRSGERVSSSPAGLSVAVGSTGSASFSSGTRITLNTSNGRDAIWSGACSSAGQKSRSCAFTLNGNAAVTANVQ